MSNTDDYTCRSLRKLLSDYLDGELDEEFCREIENHITECQDCRIVVDTLRKTILLYHETAAESAEIPGPTREKLFKTLNLEEYLHP